MARIKALVNGTWHGDLEDTAQLRRALSRGTAFRGWICPPGGAAPDGYERLPAEPGRYHLYVSYACPWAHRAILYRRLKGLEDVVGMSVLHPRMATPAGWTFGDGADEWATPDYANGTRYLYEVYQQAAPKATTRVTTPTLWDRWERRIVSRESGDIIRMLNSAFDAWGDASVDFYPAELRDRIDVMNASILKHVCTGVYKAGFARHQKDYDRAVQSLFATLQELEVRLSGRRWLVGNQITESDWHLFCTLVRFDAVYHGALKCNLYRLIDFPALAAYTRRLYELPGVAETVRFDQIKAHYYDDLGEIDPSIVPVGPAEDFRYAVSVDRAKSARKCRHIPRRRFREPAAIPRAAAAASGLARAELTARARPGRGTGTLCVLGNLARLAFELGGVWQWKPPSLFDYPQWADETQRLGEQPT